MAAAERAGPSGGGSATEAEGPTARLAALDLPALAAQLCWVTVHGARAGAAHPANQRLFGPQRPADVVAEAAPGGLVLFAWAGNCEHPQQVAQLVDDLQRAAERAGAPLPLGVAIDEEGGRVTRLGPPATVWPSAQALARALEPADAVQRWRAGGSELAALGISVDLAPVADVAEAANPVLGERTFGSDPDAVAAHAAAAVTGLQAGGVAAVAKHFPGHGATATDSHRGLPRVELDRSQLEATHVRPFRRLVAEAPPAAIMPAHLVAAAVDPHRPATLSPPVLTDLLRGDLGFAGAVVSDSLAMAALADRDPADVAVEAVAAGVDVLLCPPHLQAVVDGLARAVDAGRLSAERLLEAAVRGAGLRPTGFADARPRGLPGDLSPHRALAADIAAAALEVRDGRGRLPLPAAPLVCGGRGARTLADALRARGARPALLELPEAFTTAGLDDAGQRRPADPDLEDVAAPAPTALVDAAAGAPVVAVVDTSAGDDAGPRTEALRAAADASAGVVVDVGGGDHDPGADVAIRAFGADIAMMGAVADRLAGR